MMDQPRYLMFSAEFKGELYPSWNDQRAREVRRQLERDTNKPWSALLKEGWRVVRVVVHKGYCR